MTTLSAARAWRLGARPLAGPLARDRPGRGARRAGRLERARPRSVDRHGRGELDRAPGSLLVAHSLACALVAHLAERRPDLLIGGALLVAPADVDDRTRTPALGGRASRRCRLNGCRSPRSSSAALTIRPSASAAQCSSPMPGARASCICATADTSTSRAASDAGPMAIGSRSSFDQAPTRRARLRVVEGAAARYPHLTRAVFSSQQ